VAHVQIWGKGQLKSFLDQLFEHILETELFGKLIIAQNLDMSRLVPKFTATTSSVEQDLDGNSLWMEI
jgi:hypothetical protein